jgi:environmental stress-induced protein Ves
MKLSFFKTQDFKKSSWPGGCSTELYISPSTASYADRNFNLRISTASVEVERSTFTSLPDFQRKIMILEGEITIHHEGHYTKKLKPFDVDAFSGDWKTSAIGKCIDFNVMTRGGLQSELSSLLFSKKESSKLVIDKQWKTIGFFIFKGNVEVEIDQKRILLEENNFVLLTGITQYLFPIVSNDLSRLILTKLK